MKLCQANTFSREYSFFPTYSGWIFLLLLLALGAIYNYQQILFMSPQSLHLWRQCDCLSLTMNYFQDNNSFFEPSVHNLGRDGTGKTVSDFPIIYFTIAQVWKVFGKHEFFMRLVDLLIFFAALLSLFKIVEAVLKDSFIAIFISLLLFTSPILVYYANNFLMDVPAFSMALIGLYFFTKFYSSQKNKYFILFAAFFALGGLLKISSTISFIAITLLFVIEAAGLQLKKHEKLFDNALRQGLIIISIYIILILWYLYARSYNEKFNAGNFLLGILPIWKSDTKELNEILFAIGEHIKWAYFYRYTQIILILMLFYIVINFRRTNKTLLILTGLICAGFLGFLILFFQALGHDYYLVNMIILAPFILLTFMFTLKEANARIYYSFIFRILLIVFLVQNVDFARRRINDRYDLKGWQNSLYEKDIRVFEEIIPYLRSIGIQKEDRLIVLSDNSINITLYFMNQKGWTNYGLIADSTKMKQKIALGAKYLLIYDKEIYKNISLEPFFRNKIGSYKTVDIFKL
jgi:hypothetical protein